MGASGDILVDVVDQNGKPRIAFISIGYAKYSEEIEIEDADGNIKTGVKGLIMYDFEGDELCIPNMDEKTANDAIVELFESKKCDLRGHGICEYT